MYFVLTQDRAGSFIWAMVGILGQTRKTMVTLVYSGALQVARKTDNLGR
jgi:hypothetical protein